MSKFVFRNNTIERFFDKDYSFSGYDDISVIPRDVEFYIWWYQLPIKYNQDILIEEINGYIEKLEYVLQQVDSTKLFLVFTMDILYPISLQDSDFKLQEAINLYNSHLYELSNRYNFVKIIDIVDFTRNYSIRDLLDWKFYFISQAGLNPKLHKEFKVWFNKKIDGVELKRKKCLVLDLDNTLWSGILGEDGIDGIKIGGDYPGKAFSYFQEALLELSKTGVILTVCSKNNEQDVLDLWNKNPYIILKKEAFATYRINWIDKATNIRDLAEELNIGLDSFVFVDDNPTERTLVKQILPMVEVPDFPEQPYELPSFFRRLVDEYFKVYLVTNEDKNKTEQYKANLERKQSQNSFANFDEFIKSLSICITVEKVNDFNLMRIAQMTQKTNQFNLTTKRYTDADIRSFVEEGWNIWCISVADKFGDNGITGVIMVNGEEIDSFLLSCRILGKGIEFVFLKKILVILREMGLLKLRASYLPTMKNVQVENFYEKCGFSCVLNNVDGSKFYEIDLNDVDLSIDNIYNIKIK